MKAEEFAERLPDARRHGGGFSARCPAHPDRNPSLSFRDGDKGVLCKCHGGCSVEAITEAMGLRPRDLFEPDEEATVTPIHSGPRRLVAEYPYTTTEGEVLYTVQRFEPKDFRGKLPEASERVLYNLPQLKAAKALACPVYVVEGEKDAETLIRMGLVATTNCGGAGKWLPQYTSQLAGTAEVIVIADDDEPGRAHARTIVEALTGAGVTATAVLPAQGCKDISEHVKAGYPVSSVRAMAMGGERLGLVRLSEVAMAPARWAWDKHFALGALTYVEGDPGTSKSTVTCDLAARWSRGDVLPDGSANPFGKPVTVLMVTAEDSLKSTMAPRLYAAGADLHHVVAVVSAAPDSLDMFSLEEHVDRLREDVKTLGAKVIIIDPLTAFLGSKVDTFKDSAVRSALLPLSKLAEELHVAVVVVRHFNKSTGGKAIHKGGGSIGFIGAARAAFQVSVHPDEEGVYLITNAKNNLAKSRPTLAYRLTTDEKVRAVNPDFDIARIEWLGVSDMDAQTVLDAAPGDSERARGYCEALLAAVEDGPKTWSTIAEILAKDGFTARAAQDYRGRVLEAVRESGEGNRGTKWQAKGATSAPRRATSGPLPDGQQGSDLTTFPLPPLPVHGGGEAEEPLRCEVCRSVKAVMYWPAPHSTARCQAHNPLTGSP